MTDNRRPGIVDPDTELELRGEWVAAMVVRPDGTPWPWVVNQVSLYADDPPAAHGRGGGCADRCCAPHEQPGALPGDVRSRVAAVRVRVRCGATARTTGRRCGLDARRGERYCGTHADRAETGRR